MTGVAQLESTTRSTHPIEVRWARWAAATAALAVALVVLGSGLLRSGPQGDFVDHAAVTTRVDFAPGIVLDAAPTGAVPAISAQQAFDARADHGTRPGERGRPEVSYGVLHLDGMPNLGTQPVWVVLRHHVPVDAAGGGSDFVESLEVFDGTTGAPVTATMWTFG